jgi:hypothetical protein
MTTAADAIENRNHQTCCNMPAESELATMSANTHTRRAISTPMAHASHAYGGGWRGAASVTLHCLTGCAMGELAGLSIGVSLGWAPTATILLAVILAFVSGFSLTLFPLFRRGFGFALAFRTVWLGETISIGVMELVMNFVDYHMGGMRAVSLVSSQYWTAFALAGMAGFVAAFPVNYWMLVKNMKRCHG